MKFEKLGNIVTIKKGKKPSFSENPNENSVRVIQIDDLRNDDNIKYTDDKTGVLANEEDVLLAWDGANAGTIGFGKQGYIGSTIALLRKNNPDKFSTIFIGKFLQSKFDYLRSKATGATIPHIDGKTLRELEIPVISLPEQKHIAEVLSKTEALIAERKQSIHLLDEYLKSTFLEMFGDPVKNEKGWEKNAVIKYADCIVPGRDKPKSFTGNIPWIRTEDLINKGFVFNSKEGIGLTLEEINNVKGKIIPKGSVLLTCVGQLNVISINQIDCIINQQLHSFQCNKEINNIFLMYSLSFQEKFMYQNASTTTVPYMNKTICNSIPTIKPPLKVQTQFATIVEKTEALKAQYKDHLQSLEQMYKALSQRAFRGELNNKYSKNTEVFNIAAEEKVSYKKAKT